MNETDGSNMQIPTGLKISQVIVWLMYAWTTFGVMMLVLRVFLLAAGANLGNGFAVFVMNVSRDYLQPFRGIFPPAQISDTAYFDVSAVFAAIVYLFLGWGFHALVSYVQRKIDENLREQQREYRESQRRVADEVIVTKTNRQSSRNRQAR